MLEPEFDWNKKLLLVSDVLALLYESEHAGPYSSPSWTRIGANVVMRAILHNGPKTIDQLLELLDSPTAGGWLDTMADRLEHFHLAHYWACARGLIANEIRERRGDSHAS
jgi:hypothetical protein